MRLIDIRTGIHGFPAALMMAILLTACGGSAGGPGSPLPAGGSPAGQITPGLPGAAHNTDSQLFAVQMAPQEAIEPDLKGVSWQSPLSILQDLPIEKATSCTNTGWFLFGSDYEDSLVRYNVSRSDTEGEEQLGLFTSNWQPGDPIANTATALYRINLKTFTGAQTLKFAWQEGQAPADYGNMYVALADVQSNRWDWFHGPADDVLTIDSYGPYRDAAGIVLFAVLFTGNTSAILERIEVGAEELRGIGDDGLDPGELPEIPLLGAGGDLPESFDLSADCAPVNDQGPWGSCTAFAVGDGAYNHELNSIYGPFGWDFSDPFNRVSPKHLYVVSGELQGFPPGGGSGRYTGQVLDGLLTNGVATERNAPYDLIYDNDWTPAALQDANLLTIDEWSEISCSTQEGIENVKRVLYQQRRALPMRMSLDNSFFSYLPGTVYFKTGFAVGGHAMCVVGYDDGKQAFKVRNSWSPYWGEQGHVWIGYATFRDPSAYVACFTLRDEFDLAVAERFCEVGGAILPVLGVQASDGVDAQVVVSWESHAAAASYNIYRDDRDAPLASAEGTATMWTDDSSADGFGHTYWVQPVASGGGVGPLSSPDVGYAAVAPGVLSVNPSSGIEGSTLRFTAAITGSGPWEFSWDFGGGALPDSSSEASPEVVLAASGTYSCQLSVSNALGSQDFPFELVVNGIRPVIIPLLSRNSGFSGDQFEISVDIEQGAGLEYSWDFGTGASPSTSTEASPQITLGAVGRHPGSLLVSNQTGSDIFNFELVAISGDNEPWQTAGFDNRGSYQSPRSGPAGNDLKWRYFVGEREGTTADWSVGLVAFADDGDLIFGVENGYLYRLHPDGTFVWRFHTGGVSWRSPAIADDGTIFIGGSAGLFAINPDGTERWRFQTVSAFGAPRIGPDGSVIVLGGDRHLRSFNQLDGSQTFPALKISATFNDELDMVISSLGLIYVSTEDAIMAIDAEDGSPGWTIWPNGVEGSLALSPDERTLYAVISGRLTALDADCGGEFWNTGSIGTKYKGRPGLSVMASGEVLVNDTRARLYQFDPGSGEEIWSHQIVDAEDSSMPAVIDRDGLIYWTSQDEPEIYCLAQGGAEVWSYLAATRSGGLTLGPDGTLYFGGNDGHLYALAPGSGETFNAPDVLDVTVPEGLAGEEVQFSASTSGTGPLSYAWDFGGGAVPDDSTDEMPTVTLADGGSYNGSLTVSSSYGVDVFPFVLTVAAAPLDWQMHELEPGSVDSVHVAVEEIAGKLVVAYSRTDTKTAYYTYCGPAAPAATGDWTITPVKYHTNGPRVRDAIEIGGKPAVAATYAADGFRIFMSALDVPTAETDWTEHFLTSGSGSENQINLIDMAGKPGAAFVTYDSGQGEEHMQFAYATVASPAGPEDYVIHQVEIEDDYRSVLTYDLAGNPAIMRARYQPGPRNVEMLVAGQALPADASDWTTHEIQAVPDQGGLGAGLNSQLIDGKPVASYYLEQSTGTSNLWYSYSDAAVPGSWMDWNTSVVDLDFVSEVQTGIALVNGSVALFYGHEDDRQLRMAVALTDTPVDQNDWEKSVVDPQDNTDNNITAINYGGTTIVVYRTSSGGIRVAVLQ